MSRWPLPRLLIVCLLITLAIMPVSAQDTQNTVETGNIIDGCVTDFDASTDYFPDKIEVVNATGFEVEYFNHYKIVTVTSPWPDATENDAVSYVLLQCGTPEPEDIGDSTVIEVPVQSFVTMSTTYLPYVELYNLIDRLVGVDMYSLATSREVIEKGQSGELTEIAPNFELNLESALDLDPDLIIAYGYGFETDDYRQLIRAGLPVALNGEFSEIDPLNRAEWGKYIALFFNLEAQAEAAYNDVVEEYNALKELAATVEDQPTVFLNSPFDGVWYVPAGTSYMATFLEDAGADYLWADDPSYGTLFLDFEVVFDRAADAEFWLNPNQFWFTREDALTEDQRFGDFAAMQAGNVWINNLAINEFFANDIFESGVAYPNRILADLVAIFHSDQLPDHEFVYYQQLVTE